MDWILDPSPSSDLGGVVFANSSSESPSSIGGVDGFAFCFAGGLIKNGGSAGRRGCRGGGSALGAGRASGYGGGGGPCAESKVPNIVAG